MFLQHHTVTHKTNLFEIIDKKGTGNNSTIKFYDKHVINCKNKDCLCKKQYEFIYKNKDHTEHCNKEKCFCKIMKSSTKPEKNFEIIGKMSIGNNSPIEFYGDHVINCNNKDCLCKKRKYMFTYTTIKHSDQCDKKSVYIILCNQQVFQIQKNIKSQKLNI